MKSVACLVVIACSLRKEPALRGEPPVCTIADHYIAKLVVDKAVSTD
jgi:hypothetical protein